jgi:quercetin dioxygenase-like cupin family protein
MRGILARPRARGILAVVSASIFVLTVAGIQIAQADHLPIHGTILARGPFADPIDLKVKAIVAGDASLVQVHGAQDTIVQQVTVQPGGFTGWHSHPGPAIVVVAQGEFTYYDGDDPTCTGYPYGPGETFVDLGQGHVHSARNEGATVVSLYVTYFDVPASVTNPLIPAADPGNCAF